MKKYLLSSFLILIIKICNAQLPVAGFSVDDSLICPGTCTNFSNLSLNSTSYLWTFAGANPSTSTDANPQNICYNAPGIFSVTLIASNAIGNDTLTISNSVNVYPYPPPVGGDNTHGDTMIVDPQGFVHIQWYYNFVPIPGDTLFWHVAIPDGIHSAVAMDSNGCEAEGGDFGLVMHPDFLASDTVICVGDCISFTNLSTPDSSQTGHQWHFSGANPSTTLDWNPQNICYNTPGDYSVKFVMIYSAHSQSDSGMIHVLNCNDVSENSFRNISLSPNPFSTELLLHFGSSQNEIAILKIINVVGGIVLEKEIKLEDQSLDLSALPQGIYFVSVKTDEGFFMKKIVK